MNLARMPSSKAKLLIVDDEPLALQILEDYLSKIPFLQLVKATTNPIEALTLVQMSNVDLVFLDVQMPELDGLQATRVLRERERERPGANSTPVIAMTAHAMQGDREKCLAAGMDAYVSKPIRPEELFAAIEQVLAAVHFNPS